MHSAAIFIDILLGLLEWFAVTRAMRLWFESKGWAIVVVALAVTYIPLVGGLAGFVATITMLDWPWWLAGLAFGGGTAALALTGGVHAVLGQGALF